MPYPCNPCECPEAYYRDSQSWRKAMITLLCDLITVEEAAGDGTSILNAAETVDGIYVSGVLTPYKRAFANVAASQTDSSIVAAVSGKSILVLAAVAICGGTATTLTFNTKPGGAGTAISPLFSNDINGGEVLPYNKAGWIKTNAGEGLTVTTGAGSATGILVTYVEV